MIAASARYKRYLLVVLVLTLAFNFVDRLALGIVLQNIKHDLRLSDTQLGLLSGLAFAVFYSVLGIPIARWADRGNRVTIISVTALLWSVMVVLSGLACTFPQLLLVRSGVAVGEAGAIPPAHSLLADYFQRSERPRAASVYMLGIPLSMVVGYFGAGWLNEFYGWRLTFVWLGLPGVALALLVRCTIREPRRAYEQTFGVRVDTTSTAGKPGLRLVCQALWRNTTFRQLLFAFSVLHFFGYGILQWQPAFFIRTYGLNPGSLGSWFALIYGIGGIIAPFPGIWLIDQLLVALHLA